MGGPARGGPGSFGAGRGGFVGGRGIVYFKIVTIPFEVFIKFYFL